jgi:hypothetical protein
MCYILNRNRRQNRKLFIWHAKYSFNTYKYLIEKIFFIWAFKKEGKIRHTKTLKMLIYFKSSFLNVSILKYAIYWFYSLKGTNLIFFPLLLDIFRDSYRHGKIENALSSCTGHDHLKRMKFVKLTKVRHITKIFIDYIGKIFNFCIYWWWLIDV